MKTASKIACDILRKKINHNLVNEMIGGERAALYGVLTEREGMVGKRRPEKKKKNPGTSTQVPA